MVCREYVMSFLALAAAAALVVSECLRCETFSMATELCGSFSDNSAMYASSPRLQELCKKAESINPTETCYVGCDVKTLCRNPKTLGCMGMNSHPALCDVSYLYYSKALDGMPKVFRVARGTCLLATESGKFVYNRTLRSALLRFPYKIAIVGDSIGHDSAFPENWSYSFPASNLATTSAVNLSLVEHAYVVESSLMARTIGASADIPTVVYHESCFRPDGGDTSLNIQAASLQSLLTRAASHANQPPVVHITVRFTMPVTSRLDIAGAVYAMDDPGSTSSTSPLTGGPISPQSSVWLSISVSPKTDKMTEAREVIVHPDGMMQLSMKRLDRKMDARNIISYTGHPPDIWLGMRDASRDIAFI